ncbi:hypothetical protein [Streptomyces sp. NRRL B-24720]|uniref:hypothetical protein n=1 Tax=Streptomyces sp. NRRL B-24720 TaxID=1476876 RepID=UPI0004C5ECBA|nr:hypothetical protein [Streptomyces sp. NRRL B-24720]
MTQQLTDPTNLPAGDRRPVRVDLPTPPAPELFETPEGRHWRLAGTKDDGLRYFVPAHLDPAKIRASLWASEAYLNAELGEITPVAQVTA